MCNCGFPAMALLIEQRRICKAADDSHDENRIHLAAQYVRDNQTLWMAHEAMTGCDCWMRAKRELDHA